MVWSEVIFNKSVALFEDMHAEARFYFVHLYHAQLFNYEDIAASAFYGNSFPAAIEH